MQPQRKVPSGAAAAFRMFWRLSVAGEGCSSARHAGTHKAKAKRSGVKFCNRKPRKGSLSERLLRSATAPECSLGKDVRFWTQPSNLTRVEVYGPSGAPSAFAARVNQADLDRSRKDFA